MFVATQLDISDQITGRVTSLLVAREPDIVDEMSGRFAAENWICRDISSLFMATISDVFDKTSAQFAAFNRICSMRCQDIFQMFLATELDIFDRAIWKPKTGVGTFSRQVSNNKPHILGEDVGMSYSWKQDNFHETLGSFLVVFVVTKLDVSHKMLEQFAVKIMIFLIDVKTFSINQNWIFLTRRQDIVFASKEPAKPKTWSYLKTSILSLSTLLSKDETTSCPSTEAKSWGAESSNMEVILRDPRLDDAGYILYFEFPMTRLKPTAITEYLTNKYCLCIQTLIYLIPPCQSSSN